MGRMKMAMPKRKITAPKNWAAPWGVPWGAEQW
jgi:hypothetical protein